MEVLVAAAAWAASSLGNYLPTQAGAGLLSRWPYSSDLNTADDLTKRLSSGARVYWPGSEGFDASTARWSTQDAPNITITVEVSTEADVVETVKFANKYGKPFLAVNNGHGAITTVGKLQNGIEIWMRQLNSVKIAADGKTATFGGGILAKGVTDGLWAAGKQTVTGGCECVSIVGPGLGGGHGFLQGRYGLISDQFVSLNVVKADGKLVTVDRNHEMFWALQGAGHNFGIVTSITAKIYDVTRPKWAYKSFIFTGDKVEALYTNINEKLLKNGTQPVDVINYSFYFFNPAVDPVNPVIAFYILQEGVDAVAEEYTTPFTSLGPVASEGEGGDYRDLPRWTGNHNEGPVCTKAGLANIRFPIDLQVYDIPAQRKVYDVFASTLKQTPAFSNSLCLFEGYSLQGVKAIPSKSTAFPFRDSNLLVAPLIIYKEDGEELGKKAQAFGTELRDILHKASGRTELRAYVNYAFGNEGARQWYGYEQWRQDKLRALKRKFDPQGKFSFYAPIA
ncbi:FAD-binding domain-containing protein [Byssothecium circinans]|uniref:FAD-binding domain-containing protein n=1 Tax=Byssothecium circinans TaxID=147558 RepID=A0A6A5T8G3_9PLEO|nr:FAD-binding domain-containing protein [Byssothecium circinans]